MTNAEEKDFVLKELNSFGIIDFGNLGTGQLVDLFSKHQSTLLYRNLIEKEISPPNNPQLYFVKVWLTNAGRDFLANGGFTAEENQKNAERADRVDIKLATLRTARWQTIGVIASFILGLATISITGITAYLTYTTDKEEKHRQEKRLDRLENIVDSINHTNTIFRSPKTQSVEPVGFSADSTAVMRPREKKQVYK